MKVKNDEYAIFNEYQDPSKNASNKDSLNAERISKVFKELIQAISNVVSTSLAGIRSIKVQSEETTLERGNALIEGLNEPQSLFLNKEEILIINFSKRNIISELSHSEIVKLENLFKKSKIRLGIRKDFPFVNCLLRFQDVQASCKNDKLVISREGLSKNEPKKNLEKIFSKEEEEFVLDLIHKGKKLTTNEEKKLRGLEAKVKLRRKANTILKSLKKDPKLSQVFSEEFRYFENKQPLSLHDTKLFASFLEKFKDNFNLTVEKEKLEEFINSNEIKKILLSEKETKIVDGFDRKIKSYLHTKKVLEILNKQEKSKKSKKSKKSDESDESNAPKKVLNEEFRNKIKKFKGKSLLRRSEMKELAEIVKLAIGYGLEDKDDVLLRFIAANTSSSSLIPLIGKIKIYSIDRKYENIRTKCNTKIFSENELKVYKKVLNNQFLNSKERELLIDIGQKVDNVTRNIKKISTIGFLRDKLFEKYQSKDDALDFTNKIKGIGESIENRSVGEIIFEVHLALIKFNENIETDVEYKLFKQLLCCESKILVLKKLKLKTSDCKEKNKFDRQIRKLTSQGEVIKEKLTALSLNQFLQPQNKE